MKSENVKYLISPLCDFTQDSRMLILSPGCKVWIVPNQLDDTGLLDDLAAYFLPTIVLNDSHSGA